MLPLLVLCLCVVGVAGAGDLPIFNPKFNDPYSGTLDVLLDIDALLCVGWPNNELDTITVTIPTTPDPKSTSTTGYFVGPAFGPRPVLGTSKHGNSIYLNTELLVSWDGVSTLTFSGFNLPGAGPVVAPAVVSGSTDPNWVNVNWDIPDDDFMSPYVNQDPSQGFVDPANFPNKVPLLLVPYPTPTPTPQPLFSPRVALTDDAFFGATKLAGFNCGGHQVTGDPVFSGFQEQVFQFHGLPDEHFNLVSSPDVQLNAHFVYLSSGKCDYNDTECFTHPGTYMDVLGFFIADAHVKVVAGTHEQGLRLWINDQEISKGRHVRALNANITASLRYHHNGHVDIRTEIMNFDVVNSDMFMNVHVGLNLVELLRVGAKRHTVTDQAICRTNTETHNHQLVETTVSAKYPVNTPLHGLIGQTWRNVKVCGRDWMGTVQDYLVSDLFASDNHYNYFKW